METHKNQRLRYSKDVRSVLSGGNLNNGGKAGDYGLYLDSNTDLYYCKNGVGTKLN